MERSRAEQKKLKKNRTGQSRQGTNQSDIFKSTKRVQTLESLYHTRKASQLNYFRFGQKRLRKRLPYSLAFTGVVSVSLSNITEINGINIVTSLV